ncbi:tRNA adenosine(34) deaminase TadA [Halothermothrix orenii]|uniref:tRNA-specific adenosine deaminase n=1 Tax=Halothermothrix orenii (strain H 168 / OCM 544 / DSM 9562) TaxID=373903 RepID=B8CZX3_HALOH|nr:tRNA adenosine(34) deaminase TadA [Halothermothrix orenii]ACL70825.1 tRNA-adenosine deaminase [Halothermothrix orenii H 168]
MKTDEDFMELALEEARKALALEEVPIGAVVVCNGEIVGSGHNLKETENDPTAHAEIVAIRDAARKLSSWRLNECQLYVTIEPCPMCAGAIMQARLQRVVYGAVDPKAGVAGSLYNLLQDNRFNHTVELKSGVLAAECRQIIKDFFSELRQTRGRVGESG